MVTMKPFGNIDACPVTKATWELRAKAKKADCGGPNVYHCLTDSEGMKWEKCLEKSLIEEGHCPIFTSDGYLDWSRCNTSEPACPNSSFVSNEVYKYPWCFGNNTPTNQTLNGLDHGVDGLFLGLIIGIVGLSILTIVGAAIYFIRKKRSKGVYIETVELEPFLNETPDRILDGFARKQIVRDGLSTLSKADVKILTVLGVMGNSVSFTSRCILRKYAKRMNWKSKHIFYHEIPEQVEENTILFVYGWFGLWNDDLCSLGTAKSACGKLKTIIQTPNVKIIIGMRTDLYNVYRKELGKHGDISFDELPIDSSSMRKEYSDHFNNVKRSCKERSCSCKRLTMKMLREGNDKDLGMPLKINIIANHHDPDLISNYMNNGHDMLKAMTYHFTNLKTKDGLVYKMIEYICLKGQFLQSQPIDEDLNKTIGGQITSSSFEENKSKLKRYVRMRNVNREHKDSCKKGEYVFWHPFIYICAFHSLYKSDPRLVMTHCNVDAILQLVRPRDPSYFEILLDEQHDGLDLFKERLNKLNLIEKYKEHPLLKC